MFLDLLVCIDSSNHLERCVRHGRMIPLEPSFPAKIKNKKLRRAVPLQADGVKSLSWNGEDTGFTQAVKAD